METNKALDKCGDKTSSCFQPAARGLWFSLCIGGILMIAPQPDDYAARQILMVFAKYNVAVEGFLRRHQFFEVRDGDFQRGIDAAVKNGWIQRHFRDRYRYILTAAGREACKSMLMTTTAPVSTAEARPPL